MVSPKRNYPVRLKDYYILIYLPEHHRAMGRGYVPEQILVAEKVMERQLTPDEDVKHINGNVHDNRPSNLEVVSINSGYKTKTVLDVASAHETRKPTKDFMPCKFQRPCWKEVRAPRVESLRIATGKKAFLDYICSHQTLGDIYVCPIFWEYIDKELDKEVSVEGVG